MSILLAILVTCTMMVLDYCHARYTRAMMFAAGLVPPDFKGTPPSPRRASVQAAFWSVGQWSAASIGFVVAVKVSIWYLPFEALGLFLGTLFGARKLREQNTHPKS